MKEIDGNGIEGHKLDLTSPKGRDLKTFDKLVTGALSGYLRSAVIHKLESNPSSRAITVAEVAQTILDVSHNHFALDPVVSRLTVDDLLKDETAKDVCLGLLEDFKEANGALAGSIDGLPSDDDIQASPGQNFKDKLQQTSAQQFNAAKADSLLRRVCFMAAQQGKQAITFDYDDLQADKVLKDHGSSAYVTLKLLLALQPGFAVYSDHDGKIAKQNSKLIQLFLAQLKFFAMKEHLFVVEEVVKTSRHGAISSFSLTLSWEPGLSLNDAVKLSNQAIKQEEFRRSKSEGE